MTNRLLPDWVEWSKNLLDREDVAIALEQAYNQGYAAATIDLLPDRNRLDVMLSKAYSEGYTDGADNGWWKQREEDAKS